jgi:hypothetical protein
MRLETDSREPETATQEAETILQGASNGDPGGWKSTLNQIPGHCTTLWHTKEGVKLYSIKA